MFQHPVSGPALHPDPPQESPLHPIWVLILPWVPSLPCSGSSVLCWPLTDISLPTWAPSSRLDCLPEQVPSSAFSRHQPAPLLDTFPLALLWAVFLHGHPPHPTELQHPVLGYPYVGTLSSSLLGSRIPCWACLPPWCLPPLTHLYLTPCSRLPISMDTPTLLGYT